MIGCSPHTGVEGMNGGLVGLSHPIPERSSGGEPSKQPREAVQEAPNQGTVDKYKKS